MTPMFEPIKIAFSDFMKLYYEQIVPTTPQIKEFINRGVAKAILWAPARMIDQAEDMFAKYLRVDANKELKLATNPHDLPVIICAMAKDYTPSGRDYVRQIADAREIILPDDPKERVFKVKTLSGDLRAQIAFFSTQEEIAKSLAAQFLLFLDETFNRRFWAKYTFAGMETKWPVHIEAPDSPAMSIATEAKNLSVLAVDLTLKVTVPLFFAPKEGEPNDGKGVPGTDDPAGYPTMTQISLTGHTGQDQVYAEEVKK